MWKEERIPNIFKINLKKLVIANLFLFYNRVYGTIMFIFMKLVLSWCAVQCSVVHNIVLIVNITKLTNKTVSQGDVTWFDSAD